MSPSHVTFYVIFDCTIYTHQQQTFEISVFILDLYVILIYFI